MGKKRTFDWAVNTIDQETQEEKSVILQFKITDPELILDFYNDFLYDGLSDEGTIAKARQYKMASHTQLNHVLQHHIKKDVLEFLEPLFIANENMTLKEFIDLLMKQDWAVVDFFKQFRNECMRVMFPNLRVSQD